MRHASISAPSLDHIRIDGVGRTYGDRRVLTDITFVVPAGARVGLIGENGAGKSTLLRIAGGVEHADTGEVRVPARTGLLEQELPHPADATVGGVLAAALAESTAAAREVERAAEALAAGQEGADERLARALDEAEGRDVWSAGARRDEVVAGLGLAAVDRDAAVGRLSGGQRSRLALAALLIAQPTALLLDEPTNHLDDEALDFLEQRLVAWPGPVLLASHDRAFLDAVATRVVDLDPSPIPYARTVAGDDAGSGYGVRSSRGGYSAYLLDRRAERERWLRRFAEEQEELSGLRHEIAVTARQTNRKDHYQNARAGLTKFYSDKDAKVTSRLVRNARVRLETLEREQVRKPPAQLAFAGIPAGRGHAGPGPLLTAAAVAVPGRLGATSLDVGAGAALLVTGANGAGKSTLLHVLHGDLPPAAGSMQRAPGVRTALLEQDVRFAAPQRSARAVYAAALGEARAEAVPLRSLGLLAGRDLDRPVGALSVGQQRRVALALVLADPPDVLLLDEPTNHLSLALAEELEEALEAHPGAVLLASHDRWLRRRWQHPELRLAPA